MKKVFSVIICSFLVICLCSLTAFAASDVGNGYSQSYATQIGKQAAGKGTWRQYDEGVRFIHTYDNTYYVDGWEKIDDNWYYLNSKGFRLVNTYSPDGYWLNEDGIYVAYGPAKPISPSGGWEQSGNYWYYYENGTKVTNDWRYISGNWYYFASGGKMKTGWLTYNEQKYYLDSSGKMLTGYQKVDGSYYYFSTDIDPVGHMLTGEWRTINGTKHFFGANGQMKK